MSDTHQDKAKAIPHIIKEFKDRGVKLIIHCGDIDPKHLNAKLFGNLPVDCALVESQVGRKEFANLPKGWRTTKPGDRILRVKNIIYYLGHRRAYEFLAGSEAQLMDTLNLIRKDYDGTQWLFAGHTHHQTFAQGPLIDFINPGAVEGSYSGYEFAILDTDADKVTFSRILKTNPVIEPFKIAVISDSLDVARRNPSFWDKLAEKLRSQKVRYIIHCGNMDTKKIPEKEFKDFTVYCNLRNDQEKPATKWKFKTEENPVVEINGYKLCIQLNFGAELLSKSEFDMYKYSLEIRKKYPEVSFLLFGLTRSAFFEESEQLTFINPGDIEADQNYVVIELPRCEITFDHIPIDPLPKI